MEICSILNVMVAVTYPTIFSPRDVQIPEIRSLLAKTCFHTPAVWVWCPETLSHSHNVIGMRLLTIKLSSSLQVLYSPSISTPSSTAISSSSVWSHSSHQTSASRSEPLLSCSPCAILRYRCCLDALYLETKLLHSTPKNIT